MRNIFVIAATALWFVSSPARAEDTATAMLARIDQGGEPARLVKLWLQGNENDLSWANSMLEQKGQKRLYCVPLKLTLTQEQNVSILRNFVKEEPDLGKEPAGVVLLIALQTTFPCK